MSELVLDMGYRFRRYRRGMRSLFQEQELEGRINVALVMSLRDGKSGSCLPTNDTSIPIA